jgi:Domain of unknown function (DUF4340)
MQPRTLLAMLGVVLVLGGFIYFFEKDLPSTDERRDLEKKVVTVEKDAVEAVVVEWDGKKVRLEKEPADGSDETGGDEAGADRAWRIVEPLSARADATAVTGLLSSLTGLEKKRTLEDVDRAALGLDEPEVEVTLATADGEVKLAVGAEVPASKDRIVDSGGVYQVAGGFVDGLTKEPGEWRDKKLFTAARGDVDRITLAAGDAKVLLGRRGEDFWIESPLTDRADDRLTDELLTDVTGLRVETFLDDAPLDPDLVGLDPPRQVVEVVLKDREEPFRLELGAPVGGGGENGGESAADVRTYGRADGQLFEIQSGLDEAFGRAPEAWRSREWTALEVFKIESASIHDAAGELEVRRDGADWKRGEDRIDYSTASDFLYALTDAKAEEVVDRAAAESRGHRFEEPSLSVHLAAKDGDAELELYPEVEGFAAATAAGREAVLLLSAETVAGIHEKIDAVKNAKPVADEKADAGDDEGGEEEDE